MPVMSCCRVDESLLSRYQYVVVVVVVVVVATTTNVSKYAAFGFYLLFSFHYLYKCLLHPHVSLLVLMRAFVCLNISTCMCVCLWVLRSCVNCNSLFARFGWIFPVLSSTILDYYFLLFFGYIYLYIHIRMYVGMYVCIYTLHHFVAVFVTHSNSKRH